jgi:hypothetical protein
MSDFSNETLPSVYRKGLSYGDALTDYQRGRGLCDINLPLRHPSARLHILNAIHRSFLPHLSHIAQNSQLKKTFEETKM